MCIWNFYSALLIARLSDECSKWRKLSAIKFVWFKETNQRTQLNKLVNFQYRTTHTRVYDKSRLIHLHYYNNCSLMTWNISFSIIHMRASFASCTTFSLLKCIRHTFYYPFENYQRPRLLPVSFSSIEMQIQIIPFLSSTSSTSKVITPSSSAHEKMHPMHSLTRWMICRWLAIIVHNCFLRLTPLVVSQFHVHLTETTFRDFSHSWKKRSKTVLSFLTIAQVSNGSIHFVEEHNSSQQSPRAIS